MKFRPKTDNL